MSSIDNPEQPFSEKSDVYSFAITVWEIFTKGKEDPFNHYDIQRVIQGVRPAVSKLWPEFIRKLMLECWQTDPENRPTFQEINNSINDNFDNSRSFTLGGDNNHIEMKIVEFQERNANPTNPKPHYNH